MFCNRFIPFGVVTAWLLLVAFLPAGFAGDAATVGLSPSADTLLGGEIASARILRGLEEEFAPGLTIRRFPSDANLYDWLVRFRQIDFALFDSSFLDQLPAGEVLPLTESPSDVRGRFVARQGADAVLLQDMQRALRKVFSVAAGASTSPSLTLPAESVVAESFSAPEKPTSVVTNTELKREPPASLVAGSAPAEASVSLEADRLAYEQEEGVYTADGHVVLRQGDLSLTANHLLLQSSTQDVTASGDVLVRQADDALRGAQIQYNLSTGLGSVRQGRVYLSEKNFHLAGEAVEKSGEATYHVTGAQFTTCDGETPDWEFSADSVDITLGRYAKARNAWFKVKDVPLLYFPYLVYPVKTERESGLLAPRFGFSGDKGVQTSLAWYQVIDRNQDATLYLDYYTEKGLGTGLEYRYVFGRDNAGEARYYRVSGISDTPNLFALDWRHDGTLPGSVRLTADVEYVDDVLFFEEFGEVADDYNRDKTLATVILQRDLGRLNLAGHMRYLKDLENDNAKTLQKLPELSAAIPYYRVGRTPLFFGLESYATHFRSEDAVDGERYFMRPHAGAVFKPGSWLALTPEVALTQRYYDADAEDDDVVVPEYSLTLSTRLQKTFSFSRWGFEKLRHSIVPEVAYRYVPDVDQDGLPWFDALDRLERQNRITYALVNRLTGKAVDGAGLPSYRDLLWMRFSQSYNVDEARDDAIDDKEPFSDLRVELTLRPTAKSFVEADGFIATQNATVFNQLDLQAGVDDNAGNRLTLGYAYRREQVDAPELSAEYLKTVLDTALLAPVYLHLEERYDVQDEGALETLVGLEYRARCWSLILSFRDRPDDEEVMVNFVLAGLSSDRYW